jgi:hypothetical protein
MSVDENIDEENAQEVNDETHIFFVSQVIQS